MSFLNYGIIDESRVTFKEGVVKVINYGVDCDVEVEGELYQGLPVHYHCNSLQPTDPKYHDLHDLPDIDNTDDFSLKDEETGWWHSDVAINVDDEVVVMFQDTEAIFVVGKLPYGIPCRSAGYILEIVSNDSGVSSDVAGATYDGYINIKGKVCTPSYQADIDDSRTRAEMGDDWLEEEWEIDPSDWGTRSFIRDSLNFHQFVGIRRDFNPPIVDGAEFTRFYKYEPKGGQYIYFPGYGWKWIRRLVGCYYYVVWNSAEEKYYIQIPEVGGCGVVPYTILEENTDSKHLRKCAYWGLDLATKEEEGVVYVQALYAGMPVWDLFLGIDDDEAVFVYDVNTVFEDAGWFGGEDLRSPLGSRKLRFSDIECNYSGHPEYSKRLYGSETTALNHTHVAFITYEAAIVGDEYLYTLDLWVVEFVKNDWARTKKIDTFQFYSKGAYDSPGGDYDVFNRLMVVPSPQCWFPYMSFDVMIFGEGDTNTNGQLNFGILWESHRYTNIFNEEVWRRNDITPPIDPFQRRMPLLVQSKYKMDYGIRGFERNDGETFCQRLCYSPISGFYIVTVYDGTWQQDKLMTPENGKPDIMPCGRPKNCIKMTVESEGGSVIENNAAIQGYAVITDQGIKASGGKLCDYDLELLHGIPSTYTFDPVAGVGPTWTIDDPVFDGHISGFHSTTFIGPDCVCELANMYAERITEWDHMYGKFLYCLYPGELWVDSTSPYDIT